MEKNTFLKEYNNMENTVHDVKRKLNLNNHQYSKLYHEYKLDKETRHMNYNNAKHTTRLKNGHITVRKWIGKNKEYLGCYATQEDADTVVETCKNYNWDITNPHVQEVMQELRLKPKNYGYINGRYYVYKRIQGKRIYFDSFKCEADAIDCVNFLETIEWNKTVYKELKVII